MRFLISHAVIAAGTALVGYIAPDLSFLWWTSFWVYLCTDIIFFKTWKDYKRSFLFIAFLGIVMPATLLIVNIRMLLIHRGKKNLSKEHKVSYFLILASSGTIALALASVARNIDVSEIKFVLQLSALLWLYGGLNIIKLDSDNPVFWDLETKLGFSYTIAMLILGALAPIAQFNAPAEENLDSRVNRIVDAIPKNAASLIPLILGAALAIGLIATIFWGAAYFAYNPAPIAYFGGCLIGIWIFWTTLISYVFVGTSEKNEPSSLKDAYFSLTAGLVGPISLISPNKLVRWRDKIRANS